MVTIRYLLFFSVMVFFYGCQIKSNDTRQITRPNILLIISDDQSYPHASAYGYAAVNTPAFDRIAEEGILFTNGFAASPGCSPSRAALLTGRNCWQLGAAGTHASHFDTAYVTYPELLEDAGYHIGYTGKGWGPGNYKISGRTHNPAGPVWENYTMESPEGISEKDYTRNFEDFLDNKPKNAPFCFWLGTHEPHRGFKRDIGVEHGKKIDEVEVPAFLPDHEVVRRDILDYAYEIEWFDEHVARVLETLEASGELDNTLIIVTSDNGMAFPRAKANAFDYGIHVPLAIRWGDQIAGRRVVDDLVGFIDIAPTILEAAGVSHSGAYPMAGKSLMHILTSAEEGIVDPSREAVFASRERHSSSRYHSLSYPQRVMRTQQYIYIYNPKSERWPAGAPQKYGTGNYASAQEIAQRVLGPMHGGYHDIDGCPTLDFMIEMRDHPEYGPYLGWAVDKRPEVELYDIEEDPFCLTNLAGKSEFQQVQARLNKQLMDYLQATEDPRVVGNGDIWETYPRYSQLRMFLTPDWASQHPASVPDQPWLETHWEEQLAN